MYMCVCLPAVPVALPNDKCHSASSFGVLGGGAYIFFCIPLFLYSQRHLYPDCFRMTVPSLIEFEWKREGVKAQSFSCSL